MKILFVVHGLSQAGAQHNILRIIRWLYKNTDWTLGVLALAGGILEEAYRQCALCEVIDGNRIKDSFSLDTGFSIVTDAYDSLVKQMGGEPDCIIGSTIVSPAVYPSLRTRYHGPIITRVSELQTSIGLYSSWDIIESMLRHSDAYIAVSSTVASMLHDLGASPAKLTTISGSIFDYPTPEHDPRREYLLQELNIPKDTPIIWGCGTVSHIKGADIFYDSCRELYALGITNFHAIWAGTPDGTLNEWFQQPREAHPVMKKVLFVGEVEKPYLLMEPGDILLFPSREEAFGLAVLEVAERGVPTLAIRDSGELKAFLASGAGLLAERADPKELGALLAALLTDREKRLAMGEFARENVLRQFTIDSIAPKWVNLIATVVNCNPRTERCANETHKASGFVYKRDAVLVRGAHSTLSSMHIEIMANAVCSRSPGCNLLIFGCGHDSAMWTTINESGHTLILESDCTAGQLFLKQNPTCNVRCYDILGASAEGIPHTECLQDLEIPQDLLSLEWDVIIVNGSPVSTDQKSNRTREFIWATHIRKKHTHVFVNDYKNIAPSHEGYFLANLLTVPAQDLNGNTRVLAWSIGIANGLPVS